MEDQHQYGHQFDEDYFLRGQELGISGYTNYSWLPDLTKPMVAAMVSRLGIAPTDTVLDFGCARGYVVRAFRELGYSAYGYDVSRWAIDNADETVRDYLTGDEGVMARGGYNWVIAKDVLEHVPAASEAVSGIMSVASTGVLAVVPLSPVDGARYVVEEYEMDVTHVHRLTLASWARMFMRPGWEVTASYRIHGVKDNYAQHAAGNGFLIARRMADDGNIRPVH